MEHRSSGLFGFTQMKHSDITEKIIKAFYNVYNSLGHGFLEKVYENALLLELRSCCCSAVESMSCSGFYGPSTRGVCALDLSISCLRERGESGGTGRSNYGKNWW